MIGQCGSYVGVCQLHASNVTVACFGIGSAFTDDLEFCSRASYIACLANSVAEFRTNTLISKVNLRLELRDKGLVDCISHFQ